MGMILIAIAADMMLTGFKQSLASGMKVEVPTIVDEIDEAQAARAGATGPADAASASK